MINHKIFEVLSTFSRKEMSRFEAFVHSPYFNKHKGVSILVAYLSKIYPDFHAGNCSKETLIRKDYTPKGTDFKQLALIFTYTKRLLDQFMITEAHNKQTFEGRLLLLKELRQRKCMKVYRKTLVKLQEEMEQEDKKDSAALQNQYALAKEADNFYLQTDGRKSDPSLELKMRKLDYFYMTEKLKDAVEVHNRTNILRGNYSNRMLDGVLKEISDNLKEYESVPVVFIYYKIFQLVFNDEERFYFEALEFMRKNEQYLRTEERIVIYNYFQNYCIKQINRNQLPFLSELFQLYQLQLKEELIFDDQYLSEWHYKNIVTTAIRLDETEWVRQFIYEYKERLRPESVENAFRFNLASYYHAIGEYGKVLELLLRLEYSDLRYNLGAKALLLRTYYEMEEFEALNSLTASFYQYLQRNQLMADTRKDAYYDLFRFTKRVAQLRFDLPYTNTDKLRQTLTKLQKDIKNAPIIFNQGWLEKKVQELDGKIF